LALVPSDVVIELQRRELLSPNDQHGHGLYYELTATSLPPR
jgi:hypothetical protein